MQTSQINPLTAVQPYQTEAGMFDTLKNDLKSVFERDPAARSTMEVLFNYPGLHALWGYRISHWFWTHRMKLLGRMISQSFRGLTGIEIHPGATIGPGFFIDHGMGVVIGETAEIGPNVTLYHGVTLGGTSWHKGKRHPTLEEGVVIGAGAKILGAITIGAFSRVGANAVVVKSVPSNSVVVGIPGQIVHRSKPQTDSDHPDLEHGQLPDLVGASLISVMERMEKMERRLNIVENGNSGRVHMPEEGIWRGEDFQI
jgi:serine O-acetyltransferase